VDPLPRPDLTQVFQRDPVAGLTAELCAFDRSCDRAAASARVAADIQEFFVEGARPSALSLVLSVQPRLFRHVARRLPGVSVTDEAAENAVGYTQQLPAPLRLSVLQEVMRRTHFRATRRVAESFFSKLPLRMAYWAVRATDDCFMCAPPSLNTLTSSADVQSVLDLIPNLSQQSQTPWMDQLLAGQPAAFLRALALSKDYSPSSSALHARLVGVNEDLKGADLQAWIAGAIRCRWSPSTSATQWVGLLAARGSTEMVTQLAWAIDPPVLDARGALHSISGLLRRGRGEPWAAAEFIYASVPADERVRLLEDLMNEQGLVASLAENCGPLLRQEWGKALCGESPLTPGLSRHEIIRGLHLRRLGLPEVKGTRVEMEELFQAWGGRKQALANAPFWVHEAVDQSWAVLRDVLTQGRWFGDPLGPGEAPTPA
jgi:hypothetical protein